MPEHNLIRKTLTGHCLSYTCPECGDQLLSPLPEAGTKKACPQCGVVYIVSRKEEVAELQRTLAAQKEQKRKDQEEKGEKANQLAAEREEAGMRNERARPAEEEAALSRLATKRATSAGKRRWEMEDKTELTVIMVCAVIVAAHYVALSVSAVALWISTWYAGLSLGDQITARFNLTAIGVLAILCVVVLFFGAMDTWTRRQRERRRRDHFWAMGIWTKGQRDGKRKDDK